MASAPQVTLAREEARKKLHERIEIFEKNKNIIEYHRMTPYKSPTLVYK